MQCVVLTSTQTVVLDPTRFQKLCAVCGADIVRLCHGAGSVEINTVCFAIDNTTSCEVDELLLCVPDDVR